MARLLISKVQIGRDGALSAPHLYGSYLSFRVQIKSEPRHLGCYCGWIHARPRFFKTCTVECDLFNV